MKINLIHKNIAILWFWKEWTSTLRFLQKNGILDGSITILDKNSDLKIDNFNWNIITGDKYLKNLDKYDYIFKSPGISPYVHWLEPYKDKILTQTKLFYEFYKWKIISVTQTKWKSTTVTLTYELLKNAGYNVKLVGNIWNPVLDEINIQNDVYDFVVYELSSYMLEELENHHSYISILWNIYEDHLDWHLNFENYSNAKKTVLKNADNILVWLDLYRKIEKNLLNRNFLTFGPEWAYLSHIKNEYFIDSQKVDISIDPKIPWEHNLNNFAAILWVAHIVWIDIKIFEKTINNFYGLPHRLQHLWEFAGITFIDDAISTTPESTIEAIKTYAQKIWTVFLWGTDRGYNFEKLVKALEEYNIKNIVLFPDSGEKILWLINREDYQILQTKSMKDAIEFAYKNSQKWMICLLSTASPSYSVWKNFEQKWDEFKKEIINYNFKNFTQKKKQIKILEEKILSSKLITPELLAEIKKLYHNNPYHNYLHVLMTAHYTLKLSLKDFNILEIKSLLIASLFHDAGHNGKMEVLDEFTALDHFRKTMDKFPNFIVNDAICRNWIIGTVFKNRGINVNKFAQITADFDVWCIWEWIWEFLYYGSLYALELGVSAKKYYTDIETGYFKYLIGMNKNIIISEAARNILPNSYKTIKDFYKIDLDTKLLMFEILRTKDITLEEFKKVFKLDN